MTAETFCRSLTQDCLVAPGSHVLAAVSGGADSTALLCLLCEAAERLSLSVSCAHMEHGIRGQASQEDLAFVRALCEEKGVAFYAGHADARGYAAVHGCGLEDAARTLRYAFLERTAQEIGADVIALAHHALDQAETVLLHAARGSDLRGLCAMRSRRGNLVRPLLHCAPQELRDYLAGIGQRWREDDTNADVRYARNRVRHLVLPELERACPGAQAALVRLARAAQRDEEYFERQLSSLALPKPLALVNGLAVEAEPLRALHPALMSRLLVRLIEKSGLCAQSAGTLEQIMAMLEGGREAAVNLAGGGHARLGARYICLTGERMPAADTPLRLNAETDTPFGRFRVREVLPGETGDGKRAQAMPAALLAGAAIGPRRPGDCLLPLHGAGHTTLKKLLGEAGVERAMRPSVPILRSAGGDILWVAGIRPDAACAVRPGESAALVEWLGPREIEI